MEARNPIFMMSDSGACGNISNFTVSWYAWFDGRSNGRIMELQSSQTSVKDFLS